MSVLKKGNKTVKELEKTQAQVPPLVQNKDSAEKKTAGVNVSKSPSPEPSKKSGTPLKTPQNPLTSSKKTSENPPSSSAERPSNSTSPEKNKSRSKLDSPLQTKVSTPNTSMHIDKPNSTNELFNKPNDLETVKEITEIPVPKIGPKDSPVKKKVKKEPLVPEQIENKIKSRVRLLEMLEDQTSAFNEDMFLQIQSRDTVIDGLNKELLTLKAQNIEKKNFKDFEDTIKEKQAQIKLTQLENEKNQLESRVNELINQSKTNQERYEEEKNEFEVLQDAMTEEIELLRTQLENKISENTSTIEDIKKLSEIINQFKHLNSDLNKKIEKQNFDFEAIKIKFLESEIKVSNTIELENNFNDTLKSLKKSEAKVDKLTEDLRSLQILYQDLQAFNKFTEEKINEIIVNEDIDKNTVQNLMNIKNLYKNKEYAQIDLVPLQNFKELQVKDVHEKLEKSYREIKILENAQKPLMDEVNGMKELVQYLKSEHTSSVEDLSRAMKTLENFNDSLQTEIQGLRLAISKKELKITALSSKIISSETKHKKAEEKTIKVIESRNLIEKENNDLKNKINALKTQLQEKQFEIISLQKQNVKLTTNVQALHEEFWKKDTILLKLKKNLIQQQKQIPDPHTNIVKLEIPKNTEDKQKFLKEIFERDQKIDVLKDMLKSVHSKQKENRRKKNQSLNEDLHPEKFEKSDQDLLNSLAVKSINKFFKMFSFNKTSPDSPLDIGRIIKKLRQDLKSYSAFSVKDIQASVPELSLALVDMKSHINLDELISVISKVVYS
jgi:hypothetical protein